MAKSCDHSTPQWHLADCNEDGWKCAECGHVFGFRPDFDREHVRDKVDTILFWLVEHDFHYVSNASEGEGMAHAIANRCRETNTYDQQSIIGLIAAFGITSHAAYWRKQAEQFLCSHPSRELKGDASVCNACGHGVKQAGDGPLFADRCGDKSVWKGCARRPGHDGGHSTYDIDAIAKAKESK
jgi:hypothetical protein